MVKEVVKEGHSFKAVKAEDPLVLLLQRQANKLVHYSTEWQRHHQKQKYISLSYREYIPMVLRSLHDESGQWGVGKTVEFIQD